MQKLTKEQAIVLTGFTGIMHGSFSDFHEDVERRIGHGVFTHMFADKTFASKVKDMYSEDFLAMQPNKE